MEKTIIHTSDAPAPIGPYSQAVRVNGLLFVSGQIALDPSTGDLITSDIAAETTRVMENLKAILKTSGIGFNHVVKTTIFLSDMDFFNTVNEVYGKYFSDRYPARETVAVKSLPKNVHVEISVIAAL